MKNISSIVTSGAIVAFATMASAQTSPQTPLPTPQTTAHGKCTPVEKDIIKMQLEALKGLKSSVGQTAKDFCTALSKTEDDAMKRDNDLLSDVLALLKKHAGTEVDIKTISKMCMANQDVPRKALDEQIKALQEAALACQDSI